MGHVSDILDAKGRNVLRIDGSATVYEAIAKMVDGNVGALLVYDGERLEGIVTERDYLRRVALQGRDGVVNDRSFGTANGLTIEGKREPIFNAPQHAP